MLFLLFLQCPGGGGPLVKVTADLGDAPDTTNNHNAAMTAYTPPVPASFPTVFNSNPPGPKHLQPTALAWLGPPLGPGAGVTRENEADLPPDADGVTNINPTTPTGTGTPDRDNADDGVSLPVLIPPVCGQIQLKYTVTSTQPAKLYLNVWFDFNRDGDWNDPTQKCPLGQTTTGSFTEWAVQNHLVSIPNPGTFSFTTPSFGAANPTGGPDMWMRVTLTDTPIAPQNGADASGPSSGYQYGETEDYLLRLQYTELCGIKFNDLNGNGTQDPGEPGLSGWVIEVKDANGNLIGFAVTGPNGNYCIKVPSPGTYTVLEQNQPGWTQTAPPAPGTYTVTVPPPHTQLHFGNKEEKEERSEICISKFNDLDGDGSQDPGEPLLGGWQFTINPPPLPPATSPLTTIFGGPTCFGVSAPGTYAIAEVLPTPPPTWTPTTPAFQNIVVQPGQTYNVIFGNSASCVPAPSGMVAWWPLDDPPNQTTVLDLAGGNNHGTPKNHAGATIPVGNPGLWQLPDPAVFGGSLFPVVVNPSTSPPWGAFFFSNTAVQVPHHPSLNIGPNGITISMWVWPTGGSGLPQPLIEKYDPASSDGYSVYLDPTGPSTFVLKMDLNGTVLAGPTLSTSMTPSDWKFVAVRVTSAGSVIFDECDMFSNCTNTVAGTIPNFVTTNTDSLWLSRSAVALPGAILHGIRIGMDEVEMFNRDLSQSEIQTIYNAELAGVRKCPAEPGEISQLCILKFNDLDGDGIQDPGEPLLGGWQFNVTDQNNNPVGTITTNPPGTPPACLNLPPPGPYTVTEQVQSGWTPTTPNPQTVTPQPGQTVTLTFGNKRDCVPPPPGMVAWWPLDDATGQSTIQDLAGGNNGTTQDSAANPLNISLGAGSPVVSQLPASNIMAGQLNPVVVNPNAPPPPPTPRGALFFNNSFAEVPHNANLNIGPTGITITLWAHTAGGVTPVQPLLEKFDISANTGYSLYLDNWNGALNSYTLRFNLNGTVVTGPSLTLSSPLSPLDWHFIAVTVDASGNIQLSVCKLGTPWPCSSQTASVPTFQTGNSDPLLFGKTNSYMLGALFFAQELALDEVEIFNQALTSTDLQSIYEGESAGQRKCFRTPCVPPPSHMVAWYPLDEQTGATTVADIAPPPGSTVNDVGTPQPAPVGPLGTGPTPVAGKVGAGALYFYGPYVDVPSSPDLTFPTDFSIDAWIRVVPCGHGRLAPIVDKWDPATQTGFSFFVDQPLPSTGSLHLQLNNTLFVSSGSLPTTANPPANTGPWVHVAVTVDRTTGGLSTFYINGVPAGTFTAPAGSITNPLSMLIGEIRVPGGRCEIAIDELELFDRVLTPSEVQAIYNADWAGKCPDATGRRGS